MAKSNASAAKAAKSNKSTAAKAAKSATTSVSSAKAEATAPTGQTAIDELVAKATKAAKDTKSAKADFEKSSTTLQAAQHKSERLAVEVVNLKHKEGVTLTLEESALYDFHVVETYAKQNGLAKVYDLVSAKLNELSSDFAKAKAAAKSLTAAVRNLLADWELFEPIFKSVGLGKDDIKPSLLKEATPFLMLPSGEGLKVCRVGRKVKRDANGNPLKVDGKKQYDPTLVPIKDWDAITFTTIVLTIELSKGVFSAEAEAKHREFLDAAEASLKAVLDAKAAAKAARAAEKKAKADAKASAVPEEVASKEAAAEAHATDAKASTKAAKAAAKAAAPTSKAVAAKAAEAAKKVAPKSKAAAKAAKAAKVA